MVQVFEIVHCCGRVVLLRYNSYILTYHILRLSFSYKEYWKQCDYLPGGFTSWFPIWQVCLTPRFCSTLLGRIVKPGLWESRDHCTKRRGWNSALGAYVLLRIQKSTFSQAHSRRKLLLRNGPIDWITYCHFYSVWRWMLLQSFHTS